MNPTNFLWHAVRSFEDGMHLELYMPSCYGIVRMEPVSLADPFATTFTGTFIVDGEKVDVQLVHEHTQDEIHVLAFGRNYHLVCDIADRSERNQYRYVDYFYKSPCLASEAEAQAQDEVTAQLNITE